MPTVKSPNPNLMSQNGAHYVNYMTLPLADKPARQPCGVSLGRLIWYEYSLRDEVRSLVIREELESRAAAPLH